MCAGQTGCETPGSRPKVTSCTSDSATFSQVPVMIAAAGVYDLCGVTCSPEELSVALRRHQQPFLLGLNGGASPHKSLRTRAHLGAGVLLMRFCSRLCRVRVCVSGIDGVGPR